MIEEVEEIIKVLRNCHRHRQNICSPSDNIQVVKVKDQEANPLYDELASVLLDKFKTFTNSQNNGTIMFHTIIFQAYDMSVFNCYNQISCMSFPSNVRVLKVLPILDI